MSYQLDVSLININSRFISRILQFTDYKSYNNTIDIEKYVLRKKKSGKLDEKISLRYPNRNGSIQNYHLRLVTFFLKEGIHHVALEFIQNDCLIKLIDVKYGFNHNNFEIQILLLRFINDFNLWHAFSSQISHLLSSIQPIRLFQLINTYPAIKDNNINFNNPQFVFFTLNNVQSQLNALQFSQFSSQVDQQLSILQQQFQQLSEKESFLHQKELRLQKNQPLSSYPIRPSLNSTSSLHSRNSSQTLLFDSQLDTLSPKNNHPLDQSIPNLDLNIPNKSISSFSHSTQPPLQQLINPPLTQLSASSQQQPVTTQQQPDQIQPSPISSLFDSPKQPSPDLSQSQYILSYLQNQLNTYFHPDSNKTFKTKITKEVKQLLKQKTIQKNSIYQQYIDSHPDDLTHIKLIQKWFDINKSS